MDYNTIQIIALIIIVITFIKLSLMLFKRKSFDSFIEFYKSSINKRPWQYFSAYLFISIVILYFIRTNTDISYTEIVAISMFVAFLINAGLMSTNLLQHYDLSKLNWNMAIPYLVIWLFIMFKSLQEIFNF